MPTNAKPGFRAKKIVSVDERALPRIHSTPGRELGIGRLINVYGSLTEDSCGTSFSTVSRFYFLRLLSSR